MVGELLRQQHEDRMKLQALRRQLAAAAVDQLPAIQVEMGALQLAMVDRANQSAAAARASSLIPQMKLSSKIRCVRALDAIDSTVKVDCVSCSGSKQVEFRVYGCGVYNRCLPTYHPAEDALAKWLERKPESELYHLCYWKGGRCPSFQSKEE